MKKSNITLGIVIVFIGIFLLLNNLNLIQWSIIDVALDLWPLVLVAVGASIVFNSDRTIKTIIWVLFFLVIIGYGFYLQYKASELNSNLNNNIGVEYTIESNIKSSILNLDLAAVDLNLNPSESFLLDGFVGSPDVKKNVEYFNNGEIAKFTFKENVTKMFWGRSFNNKNSYKGNFYLNDKIFWDINGHIGAVKGNMDLRNLMVNNIDMEFGAGDLKLLLGTNVPNLNVEIEAGATNIDLVVPKDLGVRVKLEGGLKHSNLKELNWKLINGWYVSPNYEAALSKASINIEIGVGNLDIKVE